ncbi:cysteine hydrolase family protein [Mycobacterium sp.]|uniref:cysteine hydrolase family protein n=1 Tax=Mycobacterium sp. TaxID=1785 RepID=UPI003BB051EE
MTAPVVPAGASGLALLLLDFQYGVLDTIANSADVLSRAEAALWWARQQRVQVAHVRVAFTAEDFERVPTHNKALRQVVESRTFAEGSPEAAIHSRVAPQGGELVVRKTRFGAFSTTELHRLLQELGIDTLILAGVSTSGVVLSTVRDALDRDYEIYLLADTIADHDPKLHDVLVERLLPQSVNVIDTRDLPSLAGAWSNATPSDRGIGTVSLTDFQDDE